MTTTTPLVSVLMGVHNGERFLKNAIVSILEQTITDFEFVIIDDGSTDNTPHILAQYMDPRIQVVTQANQGLTRTLNSGLRLCQGRFIARMDADDQALPNRFEKQVNFLLNNPDVVMLGSGFRQEDLLRQRSEDIILPKTDAAIRRAMLSGNPFCHPAVMMRRDALLAVGGYDESFRYTQDYELWSRLIAYGRFHNLPEVLLVRRYHKDNISNSWRNEGLRLWLFMRANSRAIRRLGYPWYHQLRVLLALKFIPLDLYAALKSRRAKRANHE